MWIATVSRSTLYAVIVGQMLMGGGGLGLITAPAAEAIMGVVPKEKAEVGSAVNDATRLFGAALGVAVIGSVALGGAVMAAALLPPRSGASRPSQEPVADGAVPLRSLQAVRQGD